MLSCSIQEHPRQELDRALAEQGLSTTLAPSQSS